METILNGEQNTLPEKELETFKLEFKETIPVNINVGEITVMDATETPNIKQSSPHLSNKQSTKKFLLFFEVAAGPNKGCEKKKELKKVIWHGKLGKVC